MDKAAARDRLLSQGWLSMMPAAFSAALLDICTWRRFAANEPLFVAGDAPGGIFGIAEGAISFTAALGRADSPALHVGKAVIWTGLGPLLSGQPRRASIVAVEPVLAVYAPLAPLEAMLTAQPRWWKHIAQELLIEFDLASSSGNDLMIRSSHRRCAATLLRLADCRFQPPPGGTVAEVQIAQEVLAEMTNLSRGSVSHILRALVDDGQISMSYRSIRLLDYAALRQIADSDW